MEPDFVKQHREALKETEEIKKRLSQPEHKSIEELRKDIEQMDLWPSIVPSDLHYKENPDLPYWKEIKLQKLIDYIANLPHLNSRNLLERFVSWLKEKNSENKEYLVCPKCDAEVDYWGHDQEPLYCDRDGRKMVLTTKRVLKHWDVELFELETTLLDEFIESELKQ